MIAGVAIDRARARYAHASLFSRRAGGHAVQVSADSRRLDSGGAPIAPRMRPSFTQAENKAPILLSGFVVLGAPGRDNDRTRFFRGAPWHG